MVQPGVSAVTGLVPPTAPAGQVAGSRDYYRKLAAGVAVVTACGPSGWSGSTVSTVTSVSLEPPVLLCCLARGSRTLEAVRHARRFAVHLLAAGQADLAERFSRPPGDRTRFAGLGREVLLVGGSPVISGVLAVAWCDLSSAAEVGDHVVLYGRVVSSRVGRGEPLVWHARAYRELGGLSAADAG